MSNFSDKYSIHNDINYFDLYGNKLNDDGIHKLVETEKKEKIYLTEELTRNQSNLHLQHRLDDVENEEFNTKYFPDGLSCDEPYIYKIGPDFYHITTVDYDGEGPSAHFVGYIYNEKKLWQNISITDKE